MKLTSSDLVDLMLNEEVNEGYKGTKKGARKIFPILDGFAAAWT
jgi:hypothetical protein